MGRHNEDIERVEADELPTEEREDRPDEVSSDDGTGVEDLGTEEPETDVEHQ